MDAHTTNIANDPFMSDGSDSEIVGRSSIELGEMTSIVVGYFEDDFPQPNYHLEVSPNTAQVNATLVRTDDLGEYKLTYHLQNFSSQGANVTIRRCDNN